MSGHLERPDVGCNFAWRFKRKEKRGSILSILIESNPEIYIYIYKSKVERKFN